MEVGYNHELPTSAKISNTFRPFKHVMFFRIWLQCLDRLLVSIVTCRPAYSPGFAVEDDKNSYCVELHA